MKKTALSKDGAIDLILLIYRKGELNGQGLMEVRANYYAAFQLAEALKEIGILEIEMVRSPKKAYLFRLTEKGRKIAMKLDEVNKAIAFSLLFLASIVCENVVYSSF